MNKEEAIAKIRNGAFVPLIVLFRLGLNPQEIQLLYKSVISPPVMVGVGPALTPEMIKEASSQSFAQE